MLEPLSIQDAESWVSYNFQPLKAQLTPKAAFPECQIQNVCEVYPILSPVPSVC